jgi:hypothetical protein
VKTYVPVDRVPLDVNLYLVAIPRHFPCHDRRIIRAFLRADRQVHAVREIVSIVARDARVDFGTTAKSDHLHAFENVILRGAAHLVEEVGWIEREVAAGR